MYREKENLGYQTLAKNVLKRFVDAELRKELNEIRALKRKVAELEAKSRETRQKAEACLIFICNKRQNH